VFLVAAIVSAAAVLICLLLPDTVLRGAGPAGPGGKSAADPLDAETAAARAEATYAA
jgi:hypothetical protein